jgi:hypothetical protein
MFELLRRLIRYLASLFTNDGSNEPADSRKEAKDAVRSRMSESTGLSGIVSDYEVVGTGDGKFTDDWKVVFHIDTGLFGVQELVFDLPEKRLLDSPLYEFLASVGAEVEDDLDAALGEELDINVTPDGTINISWGLDQAIVPATENSDDGAKFVNEEIDEDDDVVDPRDLNPDYVAGSRGISSTE